MAACEACSGVPLFGLPSWAAQAAWDRVTPVSGGMSAPLPRAVQAAGEGSGAEEQAEAAGARAKAGQAEIST